MKEITLKKQKEENVCMLKSQRVQKMIGISHFKAR
jgi:hypothetical protein